MKTRYQDKKKQDAEEESRKRKREEDRAKTLFVRKDKVIRRNDLIVNHSQNKIKLESEESNPTVKQEMEENMDGDVMMSEYGMRVFGTIRVEGGHDASTSSSAPQTHARHSDNEKEALSAKLSRLEAQLATEIKTTANLRLQVDKVEEILEEKEKQLSYQIKTSSSLRDEVSKMKELLGEKNSEIKQLRAALCTKSDTRSGDDGTGAIADATIPTFPQTSSASEESALIAHFKAVLKILLQRQNKIAGYDRRRFENFLKTCRLVCKSWKQSADEILEKDPSDRAFNLMTDDNSGYSWYSAPWPLAFSLKQFDPSYIIVQKTLQVLKSHKEMTPTDNYNPLPSRHLQIEIELFYAGKWTEFYTFVTDYLHVFGKQVWYLTASLTCSFREDFGKFILPGLSKWLQLLPELKTLTIQFSLYGGGRYPHPVSDELSFPRLENLRSFTGSGYNRLFHRLLTTNQQIQRLIYRDCVDVVLNPSSSVLDIHFPNLSELICEFNYGDSLKKFGNVSWPLAKLSIRLIECRLPPLRDIFNVLARFRDTLQFLAIHWRDHNDNLGTLPEETLDLPRLKSLEVSNTTWEPHRWDTIVAQLENLETFSLELIDDYPRPRLDNSSSSEKSKMFLNYVNNFSNSRNWRELRKLKNVKVEMDLFGIRWEFEMCFWRNETGYQRSNLMLLK